MDEFQQRRKNGIIEATSIDGNVVLITIKITEQKLRKNQLSDKQELATVWHSLTQ